jgi:hypothetical protein
VCDVTDVRRVKAQTVKSAASKPSVTELEIITEILTRRKSAGSDQIPAELIQYRGKQYVMRFPNLLIVGTWNKDEFPLLFQPETNVVIMQYLFVHMKFVITSAEL